MGGGQSLQANGGLWAMEPNEMNDNVAVAKKTIIR